MLAWNSFSTVPYGAAPVEQLENGCEHSHFFSDDTHRGVDFTAIVLYTYCAATKTYD